MRDLPEAIQALSAVLAMRVENAARKKGWPTKITTRPCAPARGRMHQLTSITVLLPRGEAASFVPRGEAEGERWQIDVRRSDGVVRRSFSEGVGVGPHSGTFALLRGPDLLGDEAIDTMLDELSRPGPSGIALWIRRVWGIRFGHMPVDISDTLEKIGDPDQLDRLHSAVLRATTLAEAEALFR